MTRPSTGTVSKNCYYLIDRRAPDNVTERQVASFGSIRLPWPGHINRTLIFSRPVTKVARSSMFEVTADLTKV